MEEIEKEERRTKPCQNQRLSQYWEIKFKILHEREWGKSSEGVHDRKQWKKDPKDFKIQMVVET